MKFAYILTLLAIIILLTISVSTMANIDRFAAKQISVEITGQRNVTDISYDNVFVGSINSGRYHYPICSIAKRIMPNDEIWFSSSAYARARGYMPCNVCNPP